MDNVFRVVGTLFSNVFIRNNQSGRSLLNLIIVFIQRSPYTFFGIIFVIIGFSIGLIHRLIRS